jgi:hypothetical protein
MLTSTLEVTQKHAFHPQTKKMLHLFDMILHIYHTKRYGLCKRKRKSISVPRSMGKKEKENKKKDSPYPKIRDRIMQKGCDFHLEKFHTHAHLDLIV